MTCEVCQDAGWVVRNGVTYDCSCRAERKRLQLIARAGIPDRYQHKTFEEYRIISRSGEAALMTARRYVDQWPTHRDVGMLMTGPVGIGKTHLAVTTLMECCRRWGARPAFIDLPDLFGRIKATFDPAWRETEFEILKPILTADILCIDDVQAARQTDWAFATTEHIIDSRYRSAKSTIITTNLPNKPVGWAPSRAELARPQLVAAEDYVSRMSSPAASLARTETLGDRLGQRMFSRLSEMCIAIEMDGQDQRAEAGRRRLQG